MAGQAGINGWTGSYEDSYYSMALHFFGYQLWVSGKGSGTGAPNTYTRLLKAMDYNTSGKKPLMG